MIDKRHIGHKFPSFSSIIEAGRVRLFCTAIGETNLIHADAKAARQAGYRNVVAPLTFPTAIAMDNPNPHRTAPSICWRWILPGYCMGRSATIILVRFVSVTRLQLTRGLVTLTNENAGHWNSC